MKEKKAKLKIDFVQMSKFFVIIQIIMSVILIVSILNLKVFPIKYVILVCLALIVCAGITFIVGFLKKITNRKIKVAGLIFSVIIDIICCIGSIYCFKTADFINDISSSEYTIQNYSVIVLNDSKYDEIDDLRDKTIGYFDNSDEGTDSALEKLKEVVSAKFNSVQDTGELYDSLMSNKSDAILLEETYMNILGEEISDFSEKTKVIYTFSVEVKTEEVLKDVGNITSEPFNVYISGIDTYGKIAKVSRSDVNIIATVNPSTNQVLLTNIPRDYYVQLDGTTGTKDKLTHAGIYGVDKSLKTLENLLGIDINYYFKVNFTSVEDAVNAIGGVTAYSKYTFTSYIGNYYFKEGYNNMNGAQALAFARERKSFAEGDIMRGQNQQAIIEAFIRKATSKTIITKYTTILNSLSGKFETNMSSDNIIELVRSQLDKGKSWNITSITLRGTGSSQYTYSCGNQKLSVVLPNEESLAEAKNKIKAVLNGDVLESSYGEVTNPRDTTQVVTNKPSNNNVQNNNVNNDTKKDEPKKDENKTTDNNKTNVKDKEDENKNTNNNVNNSNTTNNKDKDDKEKDDNKVNIY